MKEGKRFLECGCLAEQYDPWKSGGEGGKKGVFHTMALIKPGTPQKLHVLREVENGPDTGLFLRVTQVLQYSVEVSAPGLKSVYEKRRHFTYGRCGMGEGGTASVSCGRDVRYLRLTAS